MQTREYNEPAVSLANRRNDRGRPLHFFQEFVDAAHHGEEYFRMVARANTVRTAQGPLKDGMKFRRRNKLAYSLSEITIELSRHTSYCLKAVHIIFSLWQ